MGRFSCISGLFRNDRNGEALILHGDGGKLRRRSMAMKRILIGLAAAATLGVAAPASAQVFFGAGPGGVEVGVGGPRYYQSPGVVYDDDCRVVRERIVRPNGRVIFRERRICD
jgi:hypothetical protein